MIFAQLFLAAICGVEGQLPTGLASVWGLFACAGLYSFFNSNLAAVNMLQSNATGLGLAAAGTINLLSGNAGLSALMLLALTGLDCFLSCGHFF